MTCKPPSVCDFYLLHARLEACRLNRYQTTSPQRPTGNISWESKQSACSRLSALLADNTNEQMMRNSKGNGHSPWTPDAQSGGPAVRAALFRNVSSPVSAVLLLFLVAHRFLCQSCPPPKARQDFHLNNTTFLFLDCLHPLLSDIHLDPFTVWFASSQSFIHSRLLLRAVLFGSLRYPAQTEKQENLFSPYTPHTVYFAGKRNTLRAFFFFLFF